MKRIFIQIASYKDELLVKTIANAINNAKSPNRIFFGICLQDTKQALNLVKKYSNTRIDYYDSSESKGIGWARATAQAVYDGEEYSMQIDSHMQFAPNWDCKLIRSLDSCPSNKAIFSQFCPDWHGVSSKQIQNEKSTATAALKWDKDYNHHHFGDVTYPHYLHIIPSWNYNRGKLPMQHAFICAHFIFAPGKFFQDVPIDPQIGYFYEENAMTLRSWTSGWDIYFPKKVFIRHTWNRRSSWTDESIKIYEADKVLSSSRFLRMLEIKGPQLLNFGLGKQRTLDEYHNFSGVNFVTQTIDGYAKKGQVNNVNIK